MKKEIEQLNELLNRCENALIQNPLYFPFESIIMQLNKIIKYEKKELTYENLGNINIGWIAVRELDGYEDNELINMLCSVSRKYENLINVRRK